MPKRPRGDEPDGRVAVGHINSPFGVRGHVKVTPLTSNPERLKVGATFYVAGDRRRVVDIKYPRGYPAILFEGIAGRDGAERLRGAVLEIDEVELPDLPEGEYYIDDLIGLSVHTTDGRDLGTLVEVLTTGSNDVYLVKRAGAKDVLIPALNDVVLDVDFDAGTMMIEAVPGLLEDGPVNRAGDRDDAESADDTDV